MEIPNFLVSTSKGVFLYKEGKFKQVSHGIGVFYGLSKFSDGYLFLTRNNYNGTDGGNAHSPNCIDLYNFDFQRIGYIPSIDTTDGHQILCKDDILYICNSGKNAITYISKLGYGNHIKVYPNEFGMDVHHINSIGFYDDKWYLCQHRTKFGRDDGGISVWTKDWNFIEYIEIGEHNHNIIIKDGFLWSCDSESGGLVKIDLQTRTKKEYSISYNCLTRGLAINNDFLLIGLSERGVREDRHQQKTGRVIVYHYPNIQFCHEFDLDNVGQTNDILLV